MNFLRVTSEIHNNFKILTKFRKILQLIMDTMLLPLSSLGGLPPGPALAWLYLYFGDLVTLLMHWGVASFVPKK
jgi:hypothetical protein